MKKIIRDFKNINPRTMAIAVPATLLYPVIRAIIADKNKLMFFSDALVIMSLVLILIGIFFSFYKKGDFDITKFLAKRATDKNAKSFSEYKKDQEAERASVFNYPLFFGIVYLIVSVITAYIADM